MKYTTPGEGTADKRAAFSPAVISVAIHALLLAFLLIPFSLGVIDLRPRGRTLVLPSHLADGHLTLPPTRDRDGGGGGDRSMLPASRGELPRTARIQLTPPTAIIRVAQPVLPVEPTIIAPPDIVLPRVDSENWGDPFASGVIPSNGRGTRGGIGDGDGGGVGDGDGPGASPIPGSRCCGMFIPGREVTRPELISRVDPEYSEQARKQKYQGAVMLSVIVQKDGTVRDIRVVRSLGMGLDEKAIEAVKQWRFRPGRKAGEPVDVLAQVEVIFRLL